MLVPNEFVPGRVNGEQQRGDLSAQSPSDRLCYSKLLPHWALVLLPKDPPVSTMEVYLSLLYHGNDSFSKVRVVITSMSFLTRMLLTTFLQRILVIRMLPA